ncbi:uncharacterized protein TRUGW13939_07593 [Talaromyces rugulosus]|uniref:Uncharacterized protein n=1 Tax=Talaromyces rugulosus TaxID=121627 RepID=A0A7H8R346_TALRU|nr:uncharacterized protein TRUGW13939_07593 [Talaromyces rugulosus]QKX60448.1 hypothetical protein TRUGW13939_07593 [Talaromyces rugulosus]
MPRKILRNVGYGWPFCGPCIACGGQTLITIRTDVVFLEHEEWKHFTNTPTREDEEPDMAPSTLVQAKDIESMYIDGEPWMWTTFYRAIIHRLDIDHLGISGITQGFMEFNLAPVPQVPRDPLKARIGDPYDNPIGYLVHAHCWLLVDRVVGMELVDTHLAIFVKAVARFWAENIEICWVLPVDNCNDKIDRQIWELEHYEKTDAPSSMWKNPAIVPEIQSIIEKATQTRCTDDRSQHVQPSMVSQIPLEVAIQITDMTKRASISDARNLLTAFGWRLPDSYWKNCSRMDLIFEYNDLDESDHPVDWQLLGLATEELLGDSDWYDKSGLKTRRRVFQRLGQIKAIFLDLIKKDETDHVFRRRLSRRKNFA